MGGDPAAGYNRTQEQHPFFHLLARSAYTMARSAWQITASEVEDDAIMGHWPYKQCEEVSFDESGITQNDWKSCPIPTMSDIPEIEVVLLNNPKVGTR